MWVGGGAMMRIGRNLHPPQRLELRLVYLCSLVTKNWIWKGEKKICPSNVPPAGNFSGNPLSYEKFELKKKKQKKKENQPIIIFLWLNYYKSTSNGSDTVLLKVFHPSPPGASCITERVGFPTSAQASEDRWGHYCWAPAAAGTGIPSGLAAAITGEPARGPRGEGVGTEEIPGRKQQTVSQSHQAMANLAVSFSECLS